MYLTHSGGRLWKHGTIFLQDEFLHLSKLYSSMHCIDPHTIFLLFTQGEQELVDWLNVFHFANTLVF